MAKITLDDLDVLKRNLDDKKRKANDMYAKWQQLSHVADEAKKDHAELQEEADDAATVLRTILGNWMIGGEVTEMWRKDMGLTYSKELLAAELKKREDNDGLPGPARD
jgi:FtsZ-binding cell division protein ZapB